MNATILARRAYGPNQQGTRSTKSTEFEVIARISHQLKRAILSQDKNQLIKALYDNRILWNTLAADVCAPENGLPADLRARIFYLNEFVTRHSRDVLAKKAEPKVLLEINSAILTGLKEQD